MSLRKEKKMDKKGKVLLQKEKMGIIRRCGGISSEKETEGICLS